MRGWLAIAAGLGLGLGASGCSATVGDAGAAAVPGGASTVQPQPPAGSCHARGRGKFSLPDRHCTPGVADRRVTQDNLHSTICRPGYSASVRPPASVTRREKLASMKAYGDHDSPHHYEYDHLISLELGGAPNDARNLWPEPGGVPNPKDKLENRLRGRVCDGALSLAAAQRQIAGDWVSAYHRLFGATP
jgi:hypothetical protein